MTTALPDVRGEALRQPPVPAGGWRVDPLRSSASFAARIAGRPVRGRVPLTGRAIVSATEGSTACLVASASELSTGSSLLDRLLLGPGFLDAEVFPEISFRSETLVCVPTGWRALGRIEVKGREHAMECELAVDPRNPTAVTSRWVLDSRWVTNQRVLALSRSIAMTCSVALEPAACSNPAQM